MWLRLFLSVDLTVFTASAIVLGMQGAGIPTGVNARYDFAPLVVAICTGIASIITAVAMMRKQGTAISKTDEVIKQGTEIHTAVNSNMAEANKKIDMLMQQNADLNRRFLEYAQRQPSQETASASPATSSKPIEMKLVETALPLPVKEVGTKGETT